MNNWWLWSATIDYGRRGLLEELEQEQLIRECRGKGRAGTRQRSLLMLLVGLVIVLSLALLSSQVGTPGNGF